MAMPIHLQFTPEKSDYIKATRALAKKSTGFLVLVGIFLVAMIASVIILVVPGIGNATWANIAIIVLLMGVFYTLYFLVFVPFQLSQAFKKNEYLQMTREFTISDEHLLMEIGDKSTQLDWENFEKVIQADDFYLLIYKAQEKIYPFIPKHAFKDQTSETQFLQLLESKSIPVK